MLQLRAPRSALAAAAALSRTTSATTARRSLSSGSPSKQQQQPQPSALPFTRVGVVGMGLMGHGIAQVAAEAGFPVTACDTSRASLDKGLAMIEESLKRATGKAVSKGQLSQADADRKVRETLARIDVRTDDVSRLASSGVDLVVEAVVENLAVKRSLFEKLGRETAKHAVLASNTSSFPIEELSAASGRPAKVVGVHLFNPVQVMPLVEVVATKHTDADTMERAVAFVRAVGKTPVKCKDTPGFIVNRLLVPYLAEAMAMVDRDGVDPQDVDTAMKLGAGHPMGPLRLADYIGLDTCLSILKGWVDKYPGQGFFVPACLERLVKEGKLGRKSGQGFYKW